MLVTAKRAAKEAGKILLNNYHRNLSISHKSRSDLVCDVDWKAEMKVISIIKKNYPKHNCLCEEHGKNDQGSRYTWLIDALDGTINYIHQIPFFCVSIGLLKDDKPYIGVVYDPLRKELFYAQKGKGAFLNGKRIRVSPQRTLSEAMLCTDLSTHRETHASFLKIFRKVSQKIMGFRILNATSLNLALVAAGRFDLYSKNIMDYADAAPGAIIIQEAGGKVTTFDNCEISPDMKNMVATNGLLHNRFSKLIT